MLLPLQRVIAGRGLALRVAIQEGRVRARLPSCRPFSADRKAGVASDQELEGFLAKFGAENVVVVDARNPNFEVEPGDAKSDAVAPISGTGTPSLRPRTVNLVFDRESASMPLEVLEERLQELGAAGKDTPLITHCGGGGRGQRAREFLERCVKGVETRDWGSSSSSSSSSSKSISLTHSPIFSSGYKTILNGGGPKVKENWERFGGI